ncbi:hypothetical protein ABTB34_21035, partial [Acinetobacter baumannii]
GQRIGEMLDEQRKVAEVRKYLDQIYNQVGGQNEEISSLSDDEVTALAQNLRGGVPIATPVFDGAHESEIKALLKLARQNENGQQWLYDGR